MYEDKNGNTINIIFFSFFKSQLSKRVIEHANPRDSEFYSQCQTLLLRGSRNTMMQSLLLKPSVNKMLFGQSHRISFAVIYPL